MSLSNERFLSQYLKGNVTVINLKKAQENHPCRTYKTENVGLPLGSLG